MVKKALFFTLFFISCPVFSQQVYSSVHPSAIRSVYDGDTFRVDIPNWPAIIGKNIPIRVNGIDTPEIRGHCALEKENAKKARELTRQALNNAHTITLKNLKRGKYFRIVADVFINEHTLSHMLIEQHLAYRYYGGKKRSWCS